MIMALKKLILICFILLGPFALFAQDSFVESQLQVMVNNEHRTFALKSTKQIASKCRKDAKKQAKILTKEGWKPAVGAAPIEDQLYILFLRQYEIDGNYPKYIIGRAHAVASNYTTAHRTAESRARAEIASNIAVIIKAIAEDALMTKTITAGEVETLSRFMVSTQQEIRQHLGKTDIVFEIYREKKGATEFQMCVSYDGEHSKELVRKAFGDNNAELKTKFEKLLIN